jgi:hypothetical protein
MEHELSRQEVENLVIRLLQECPLCVIATCSDSIPRASTVEFFPMGTTVYILTRGERRSKTLDGILTCRWRFMLSSQDGQMLRVCR